MITLNKRDSLFWKFAEYIIIVFALTFPFLNYNTFLYGGTSSRAVNLIFIGVVLALIFSIRLFSKKSYLSIPKSPILLFLVVYGISIVISAFLGLNFNTSFWSIATRMTGIWYLVSLFFVIYIMWGVFSNREKQDKVILMVILSTALYSFLSFLSGEGIGLIFNSYKTDAFTFGNSSFAGMYVFGAFILSIYYLLQSEIKKWWKFMLPVVILINPNIVNSRIWFGDFSQGLVGEARASAYVIVLTLLSLLIVGVVSKIKDMRKKTMAVYSLLIVVFLIILTSSVSLLSSDGYVRELYMDQATAARPLVWEVSENIISKKPVFGWGTDNLEKVFSLNYDNRLLQENYGNEAWFDRAHNIYIDQLVDNGYIGLIAYFLIYVSIIISLVYVALKSENKKDKILSTLVAIYFCLHFVELQTAFDTTISYFMVAIMVALSVSLYDRTRAQITKNDNEWEFGGAIKYSTALLILVFFTSTFLKGWIPFVYAQVANGNIRTAGSSEKRMQEYSSLLASPIDKHSFLWRTFTDFQKGVGDNPSVLQNSVEIENLKKEMVIIENAYKEYINENPEHFRAYLNLADVLMYQSLLGVDKINEAEEILEKAIALVPQAPQSYWMKSVADVYVGDFSGARGNIQKALDLNPNAVQSQEISEYVEKAAKDFPKINLYFFRQI